MERPSPIFVGSMVGWISRDMSANTTVTREKKRRRGARPLFEWRSRFYSILLSSAPSHSTPPHTTLLNIHQACDHLQWTVRDTQSSWYCPRSTITWNHFYFRVFVDVWPAHMKSQTVKTHRITTCHIHFYVIPGQLITLNLCQQPI